jgi:hypothetical protein
MQPMPMMSRRRRRGARERATLELAEVAEQQQRQLVIGGVLHHSRRPDHHPRSIAGIGAASSGSQRLRSMAAQHVEQSNGGRQLGGLMKAKIAPL